MCVVSTILASSVGTAIASGIASAASAVGSGLAAVGIGSGITAGTAATIGSVGAATLVGGTIGAGTGMAASAISGGNLGKGALIGGATGGVLSGLGEGIEIAGGIPVPGTDITLMDGGSELFHNTVNNILPNAAPNAATPFSGGATGVGQIAAELEVETPGWSQQLTAAAGVDPSLQAQMQFNQAGASVASLPTAKDAGGAVAAGATKSGLGSYLSPANIAKVGSVGLGIYQGISGYNGALEAAKEQSDLLKMEAQNTRELAEGQAALQAQEASLGIERANIANEEADLNRIRALNAGKEAEYGAQKTLDAAHQAKGKIRAGAAGRGVMLEGRAEAAPSIAEQDASAEAAWEVGKLKDLTGRSQDLLMRQRAIGMKRAANMAASASLGFQRAALTRRKGMFDADYKDAQARAALKTGNLTATNSLIAGLAGAAIGAAGLWADA